MSLRKKTLIIFCVTLSCLIILLYLNTNFVMLQSFEKLEEQNTRENVRRLLDAINYDIFDLNGEVADWAGWDDTYNYIDNPSEEYIESTLPDNTFSDIRINLIIYVNSNGEVVFGKSFDIQNRKEVPVPDSLLEQISLDNILLQHNDTESSVKGLVNLPEGPMIIASRPILTSERKGPIRGTLIMGRYLDSAQIDHISERTHLPISVHQLNDLQVKDLQKKFSSLSSEEEPIFVQALNTDSIIGYALIKDIYEKPILILKTQGQRTIYYQGKKSMQYFLLSLLAAGLVFSVVTIMLLEKAVLSRLAFLSTSVDGIAVTGDLRDRISMTGRDELSSLANTINQMLNALEQSKQIKESEERYRQLFDEALTGNYICTPDGKIILCNPAFVRIFGFNSNEQALSVNVNDLFLSYRDREEYLQLLKSKKKLQNNELQLMRQGGEQITVVENVIGTFDNNGELVQLQGYLFDITERKKMEEQLQYLATHDSLTSLPNRYFLEESLKHSISKAKRGTESALLLIDIDNFKIVNDSLGHVAGDEVLIILANTLKSNLREGDLIARIGGDEFCVLLEGLKFKDAEVVAKKLCRVVDEKELYLATHKKYLNLTISVGLVKIDGTLDCNQLLSRADLALYMAKEGGRNRVSFIEPNVDIESRLIETNHSVKMIKNALKENQFVLFFQPVVDLSTGEISHHEVLIRMKDENGELIPPGKFIPIAEHFGLMSQIDRWVVQSSLEVLSKYDSLCLFVNLSGTSLGDESLLELIETNIGKCGLDPSRIGFEITETAAVKNLMRAEKWITRIKSLGCRFALDDFGVGFSSFSYLSMLPVDYLKLDGYFIRNLDTNPEHLAIIKAINAVARALGKQTIAEFVENENIIKILQNIEINYGQGYFLGKPSPKPYNINPD